MESKRNILLLFAHPSQTKSDVNVPMFIASQGCQGVTAVDLYAEYPDYQIDVEKEQQRLLDHDVIVFMFPLYWYSTPAMFKEWQDLVLEYGFAYGTNGNALNGKRFICAISAGGKESAYQCDGYNHFKISELLTPLQQTANLTGMTYLPPYALFGSRTALDEGRLQEHIAGWCRLLKSLRDGTFDEEVAVQHDHLAPVLDSVVKEA